MIEVSISRRTLLLAGLTAGFVALFPETGLSIPLSNRDSGPAGQEAKDGMPYMDSITGPLADEDVSMIVSFAGWSIEAWGFENMDGYLDSLKTVLQLKTNTSPSYLEEYRGAASLVRDVRARFSTEHEAFVYLLFAERNGLASISTRLGRARKCVFEEIVQHLVASGGFRKFGLVNYGGRINLPFTNPNSYRRAEL